MPAAAESPVFTPLLIACTGSPPVLARALGENIATVRSWYIRDRVPPEYWEDIAAFAQAHGIVTVTFEALRAAGAVVAQRKRSRRTGRISSIHAHAPAAA